MTLSEMIDHLTMLRDELGDRDPEVRIAYQPSWPLRANVANIAPIEMDDEDEDPTFVWIAASEAPYGENPYAPRKAWEAC